MPDPPELALKLPARILSALKMPSVTRMACFDYSKENSFFKYLAFLNINFCKLEFGNSGHTVKHQRSVKSTEIKKKENI